MSGARGAIGRFDIAGTRQIRGFSARRAAAVSLAGIAAILAVVGCTAAAATPSAGTTAPAAETASMTANTSPTPIDASSLSASPSANNQLANLGHTPTAPWTGINWLSISAGNLPTGAPPQPTGNLAVNLFGWSRGFVDFIWNPSTRSIVPWSSADGITWAAGTKLDMLGFADAYTDWDQFNREIVADGYAPGVCDLKMQTVSEGPASLVAFGWVECSGAPCGSTTYIGSVMWVSPDGVSWSGVDTSSAFGGRGALEISGGSSGFIALGGQAVWTSQDGQIWHRSGTPAPPSDNADVNLTAPASFGGGFVLGGAIDWGVGACAYALGPVVTPAIWWSADGAAWTQGDLSGGTVGNDATMSVSRISDHALLAVERGDNRDDAGNDTLTYTAWTSTDGRTWVLVPQADVLSRLRFLTNGTRCIGYNDQGRLYSFDDKLKLTALAPTGTAPSGNWTTALGPTGILVTVDGTHFWIGVPTSS